MNQEDETKLDIKWDAPALIFGGASFLATLIGIPYLTAHLDDGRLLHGIWGVLYPLALIFSVVPFGFVAVNCVSKPPVIIRVLGVSCLGYIAALAILVAFSSLDFLYPFAG